MEWRDEAIVLSTRPFGEADHLAMLLTREHGRHAGLGRGQKSRGALQPGTRVAVEWRARLSDQLGRFSIEVVDAAGARLIDEPLRLLALQSACALIETSVPEREALPELFDGTVALLEALEGPVFDAAIVIWELGLLGALGFGLELDRCAVGGGNDDLVWVSPRTGRAVSASAGEPYADRLLPLPGFLIGRGPAHPAEVLKGMALTGHFIERNLLAQTTRTEPPARKRYVDAYRAEATRSGSLPP